MNDKQTEIMNKIYDKATSMTDEEFKNELDKYSNDEFTLALKEMGEYLKDLNPISI